MHTSSDILGHPKGLFVCFATEMWERFSYYGMRALLILYLTKHWEFSDAASYLIYGAYTSLVYIMPVFGGMLADQILGSKKAVTYGAILLVFGHLGMTVESNEQIFYLSLALIVSGVGFLKPNIQQWLELYMRRVIQEEILVLLSFIWGSISAHLLRLFYADILEKK